MLMSSRQFDGNSARIPAAINTIWHKANDRLARPIRDVGTLERLDTETLRGLLVIATTPRRAAWGNIILPLGAA